MVRITYRNSDLRGWYSIFRNGTYIGEAQGKVELKKALIMLRAKKKKKK